MTGTLRPADEVSVGTQAPGRIAWVVGKEGTPVRRGQVLVRLDDQDAQVRVRGARAALDAAVARLAQAKAAVVQQVTATDSGIRNATAALEAAKASLHQETASAEATEATLRSQVKAAEATLDGANSQLDLLRNGSRSQERAMAEHAVQLAQATWENDKANHERTQRLYQTGAVAKFDLDGAETKLRISRAQLDSAKQQFSLVQTGARPEEIQAAEAAVRQAEQALAVARDSLKQIDVARARVEIAKAGVTQAKAGLDAARSSRQSNIMRDKDVLAAAAGVEQAREVVNSALQDVSYTHILSPVDGVVAGKLVEVGECVGSGAAVIQLSANHSLYFEAAVSEIQAPRLRQGQTVQLVVDALQGDRASMYPRQKPRKIAGIVEKVVPVVDRQTRDFTVRVLVPKSPSLFPGMFARGSVVTARHGGAITVPRDVLVEKAGRQCVFVVENGAARARAVALGATDTTSVQVLSGLAAGDQVVTSGQQSLADGDRVTVVRAKE